MKAVLISIRKEHNKNIFDGTKRFEGRKTLPTIIPLGNHIDNTMPYAPSDDDVTCYVYEPKAGGGCGKVVGWFICDFAQSFHPALANMKMVANALCVTENFAKQYFNRDRSYMLRVCVPERYDKPKELSEFKPYNRTEDDCKYSHLGYAIPKCSDCHECYVKRPPQSWCYVEEV